MIRATFHVDPEQLSTDEWARLFSEAVWIEQRRQVKLAEILSQLFDSGQQ